ncbi:MAG: acyltransferase [Bacteroidia bacterium]|nr:acyltransferase [Bacteroidia bacterium]
MKSSRERIVFLDYLRVISCFLVLMVHSSEQFYGPEGNLILSAGHRLWIGIWDGFARISVPLFMICSAYLLLPMKEEQTWGEFYKRRFLRVVPPMLVFMVLYAIYPAVAGVSTWSEALTSVAGIPFNFPYAAGHLWFMYPLLGMYLLIPFISPWLRTSTARQERLFIYIWLVTTCIPYLNRWCGDVWGQCWWNQYDMLYNFAGYPGYFVLAHYIREHIHWDRAKRLAVGIACTLVGYGLTFASFFVQAEPGTSITVTDLEIGWCFCTLNCVIFTFGAFLLFTCITKPGRCYPLVRDISEKSYGMYLMHMFFLFSYAPLISAALPIWAAIPAIALASYITSYAVTKLISFIPGSKWVIGC